MGGRSRLTERSEIGAVFEGKDTPAESREIMKVIKLAGAPLRKVIRSVPKNEKEVQDAYETLLVGAGVRYSREVVHIEYSSKSGALLPVIVIVGVGFLVFALVS